MKKNLILYALILPLISFCLSTQPCAKQKWPQGEELAKTTRVLPPQIASAKRQKSTASTAHTETTPSSTTKAQSSFSSEQKACLQTESECHKKSLWNPHFIHHWLQKHVFKGELGELYHQGHEIIEHHEGRWFNLKQIVLTAIRWRHLQPQNHKWDEHIRNFGFMFALSHGTEVMTLPLSLIYCLVEGGSLIVSGQSLNWAQCASYVTGSLVISNPGTDPLCWLVFAPYFTPYINKFYRRMITRLRQKSFQFFNNWLIERRPPEQHLQPWWQPMTKDSKRALKKAHRLDLAEPITATSEAVTSGVATFDAFMLLPIQAGALGLQRQGLVLFFKKQGEHTYLRRLLWPQALSLGRAEHRQLRRHLRVLGWNVSSAVQRVLRQLEEVGQKPTPQLQQIIDRSLPVAGVQLLASTASKKLWQVDFEAVLAVRHERKLSVKKLCHRLLHPQQN